MIRHAGLFTIFFLCISGMMGCNRSSGGSGKASELFADPKVVAMAEALQRTDLAKADQLLREGVDINATGKDGKITLPLWTMLVKNKTSFKWLFDHGADPNALPKDGDRGPLHYAAAADDSDWLEILLVHKPDVNLKRLSEIEATETPLTEAISERRKKNLEMLIKAGADINFRGTARLDGGGTPAIDAAGIGWFEGVYILLEAGADYRPLTTGGWDLTYEVVRHSIGPNAESLAWRDKVLQLLKERGADIEAAQKKVQEQELKYRKEHPWMYK